VPAIAGILFVALKNHLMNICNKRKEILKHIQTAYQVHAGINETEYSQTVATDTEKLSL
jgi:archaellum component FlaF (FlaF/FlaG flagellin family)